MILDLNYKPQNEIRNIFNSIKGFEVLYFLHYTSKPFLKLLFDYTREN
jgi:hypothetical protein